MKKRIIIFLLLMLIIPVSKAKAVDIKYSAHSQNKGWMTEVSNGELAGTTGLGLRMESIKISISDDSLSGSVEYQVHSQNKGWMSWSKDGELAGTTGLGLRMEAIKIRLTGEISDKYMVYYRVHSQNKGWMSWKKDGELAGTTGLGLRMEAIEIKLVSKEDYNVSINYSAHNCSGWLPYVNDGELAGTTGMGRMVDLVKIKLNNFSSLSGDIRYQSYNGSTGWQDEKNSDQISGLANNRIEAIKISLTGELAEKYNIYYRVHSQNMGWMDWTSNGKPAGTVGYFKNVEALEIKLQKKEESNVVEGSYSYREYSNDILYSSHIEGIGWVDYVKNGATTGTTGQSKRVEAYKIKLDTRLDGEVVYKTYITKRGWSSEVKNDSISGTTGLSRTIEAIQINLNGEISQYFDIFYRVHVSNLGWMGWTSNGQSAGCINSDVRIEAIEIKLLPKGQTITEAPNKSFRSGNWVNNTEFFDAFGRKATGFKLIDGVKYYFNSEGKQYGKNVQKVIDVSSWQEVIDWEMIKKNEDVDAAIIRVGWGTSYNDPCGLDSYFDRNIKEVQRLGIPYGVYIYAYAETTQAAQKEADFVISKLNQYNAPKSTWVWYDAEIYSISRNTYNTVIPAFINKMKSAGYNNVGVYSGVRQLDTTNGNTNTSTIRSYPIWVSQYYKDLQYTGTYKGWQYASDEHVDGISGNVDVSMFKK